MDSFGEGAVLTKEGFREWLSALGKEYKIFGPIPKGGETAFGEVSDPVLLEMDLVDSLIPPTKFFHPPKDTLFNFKYKSEDPAKGLFYETTPMPPPAVESRIIVGVHACDLAGILLQDKVFYSSRYPDPSYIDRRRNTLIIALNCFRANEYCICTSVGSGPEVKEGYDLALSDLGEEYLVEIGSLKGAELLQKAVSRPASDEDFRKKKKSLEFTRKQIVRHMRTENLPAVMLRHLAHPSWKENAARCVSCGACTMTCPTCFCYTVRDELDIALKGGKRLRQWDSCQLLEFAEVAMGENFRKDREARMKWRIYHKLCFWWEQFGASGCVGCGRCIKNCVTRIDMTQIVSTIRETEEAQEEVKS